MNVKATRALAFLFTVSAAAAMLGACGADDVTIPPAPDGGGASDANPGADSTTTTDSATGEDVFSPDASDASPVIVDGPGKVDDMCTFNKDCMAALRCECSDPVGCSCQKGVRGTGRNGIDPCPGDDGSNLCASALCIEGPMGKGSFCSDECKTDADCTGMLPRCANIAFVGMVCIRAN